MSLIKQLWLAIIFILVLATGGSFVLSTLSSKNYLEEQLQLKNLDNVTSLALSISQMQKDPTTIDLLISAQFDAGHYRYIGLFDPSGKMISERVNANSKTKAPMWFTKLIPIKAQAGVAEVQDSWKQFGSITLESDANFAYDKLWDSTIQIALWASLIGLLACYGGGKILEKILSPLDDVVNQAKAIGENRFISIAEPKTTEFKAVVNAMNGLSNRIKNTVTEESSRLEELRYQANFEPITGLMNFDYFIRRVNASISHEETFSSGILIITRLANLALIDHTLGHQETNALLKKVGDALDNECKNQPHLYAARLTGTDFGIFCTRPLDIDALGLKIKELLINLSQTQQELLSANFLTVAINVTKSDTAENIVSILEAAEEFISFIGSIVDTANTNHRNTLHIINHNDLMQYQQNDLGNWQILLTSALDNRRIKLEPYPVINQKGQLIHNESPVRLQLEPNGKWYSAGEFITWATQLNLMSRVDELVLETALGKLAIGTESIGLNLSASSICKPEFIEKTCKLIKLNISVANRLYFEVPEKSAFEYSTEFRHFCNQVKPLGCKVGIEHVGTQISRLGELHDVGLDYIKIDVSIIKNIDSNEDNKTLLRGLCMIAHSIGVMAIAEGVQTIEEQMTLKQIGVDGMTGPGIHIS
ncbi:MAG: EAL domain-containing protein [Methylotenera sp.]|uniref:bifunctional diguanylate cyclase/phosphodiesterase n=1 Tax=Methylotenera sp. TaxID=2051956 RepID=UPI002488FF6D|nr:EAL domain-containing protein [Methylotenera sp.]MDI1309922.1 EAL domain-containing protein [Methylotenera sp.]